MEMKGGARSAGNTPRWSVVWGVGMLAIFVGERLIGSGGKRTAATVLGLLLVLAAIAVRFVRARAAAPDRRVVERTLGALYALGLGAILLYVVQSDLWTSAFGAPLEKGSPKLATALGALWPAIWIAAALPILFVEMAYAQIARAPRLELGRIRSAMMSGLGLAGALVFAFSFAYVASERDGKLDLAYFRTSRPGEVTRKIVRNLDQPIEVATFFPASSEILDQVNGYLEDLSKESSQLKLTHYDYDIDPVKAKEYGVTTNSVVVFVRGTRKEQLGLPRDVEGARNALKTFDKEVQQRFMLVVKPPRMVGFTVGHGERSWDRPVDNDKRSGIKVLRDMLVDQTYDTRTLSAADGLLPDVDKGVTMVAIIGPQRAFLPDELASLSRFIDRGGRLLLALDPEFGVDFHEVLGPLNLTYKAEQLVNDQAFATRTHTPVDRLNLVTATYTSHPSVTTLQRLGGRAPIILPGAGWIDAKKDRTSAIPVDAPIKAHHMTFVDRNGNYEFDPGETRRASELAATATKGEARVFVLADSDALSDDVIRAVGNPVLALDVTHWLMGDEGYSGVASTEADVPITHTRKQDVIWFYGTIFLAPALVIAAGVAVTRGARRKRRLVSATRGASGSEGGAA
jgi:hypothetical protein